MSDLTIRHATADDWPIVAEMGARIFLRGAVDEDRYQADLQSWLREPESPGARYETAWLGIIDGQIAAHVGFVERTLRYGCAELAFGGISGVMTRPEYRRLGYADRLMRVALDQIALCGHPITLLGGIQRYYNRFGYVTVWPDYVLLFEVKDVLRIAPEAAGGYHVRPFQPDDVPALLALYENEWRSRPWGGKRSVQWMVYRLGHPMLKNWVVEDTAGAIQGYSVGRHIHERHEVLAADQAATAALLRHSGELLSDQPNQTVKWLTPHSARAARYAPRLCPIEYQVWVSPFGGWMGRFIHPQKALDALHPEFVSRLDALNVPGADAAVFEAGADSITVRVGAQCLTVPQSVFLQLVFGFLLPDDIDDLLGAMVDNAGRDLLKHLFPPAMNSLAGLDWF